MKQRELVVSNKLQLLICWPMCDVHGVQRRRAPLKVSDNDRKVVAATANTIGVLVFVDDEETERNEANETNQRKKN